MSDLPAAILTFATTIRDHFGPGVRLKFAATDSGEIHGNPAYDFGPVVTQELK